MNQNNELIFSSIKSNLSGNTQNDLEYIRNIISKYPNNAELLHALNTLISDLENKKDNDHYAPDTSKDSYDTSIDDGVLQENNKAKKTTADKQIREIKMLFKKGTRDSELKLIGYELPKLKALYERTESEAEKIAIRSFANYNFNGLTPLHLACYYEDYSLTEFFISIGADVNSVLGVYKITPLDYLLYDNKGYMDTDENKKKIEMLLIDNNAKKGSSVSRILGLLIFPLAAMVAFLVASIFNPLFIVVSIAFAIISFFIYRERLHFKAKKKKTAILLAILGAGLGLHKFYLNNLYSGFIHLLISIFTFFIGGIILSLTDIPKIKNDRILDAGVFTLKG